MMTDEVLMGRWGVTKRTLDNWRAKGVERGVAPPVEAEDPEVLLEWYRSAYGREPGRKVREAAERLRDAAAGEPGLRSGLETHAPVVEQAAVAVIVDALDRLGLSLTLARVVEEDEQAWAEYKRAQENETGADAARRRWIGASEAKRQVQKTDDAVQVAMELFKGWVRTEWEPEERRRRNALKGAALTAEDLVRLREAETDRDLMGAWDKAVERGLGNG